MSMINFAEARNLAAVAFKVPVEYFSTEGWDTPDSFWVIPEDLEREGSPNYRVYKDSGVAVKKTIRDREETEECLTRPDARRIAI